MVVATEMLFRRKTQIISLTRLLFIKTPEEMALIIVLVSLYPTTFRKTFLSINLSQLKVLFITLFFVFQILAAAEQHSKLQLNLIQNTHVIQCLIENAKWLFSNEERSIVSENKNGFASLIMPPYPSSSSVAAKKSYGGSNTQILQMQPKYEEREIKFKTAAMPSSVSTSHINKQPPPTFLERVRYIQPATKQIPLSKRYGLRNLSGIKCHVYFIPFINHIKI